MKDEMNKLLDWYHKNQRKLPWREDLDPYHVWISEVMLQQTRIDTVIPYYQRFIKNLPTISDLASVSEEKLLKLWEGLGYYNRARNLKKAAEEIVLKYQGKFPDDFSTILSLPGIGLYTASAIASICFSKKEVCIDGNILRVYQRVHNCFDSIDLEKTRKKVRADLMKIIPEEAGDFNQALMELGEVICIPNGIPKCHLCPLSSFCKAKREQTFMMLPVHSPKKEKRIQDYTVLVLKYKNFIVIKKRKEETILKNLWGFPMISGKYSEQEVLQYLIDCGFGYKRVEKGMDYTHVFTHLKWRMQSFIIELDKKYSNYKWVDIHTLMNKYAIPSSFQPFVEEIKTKKNTF